MTFQTMMANDEFPLVQGTYYHNIVLETCRDTDVTRPRVRPLTGFPTDIRVEFPRKLRELYPIGTRYRATVKVCQKHWDHNGLPKGDPYLLAKQIIIIVESISDEGLRAKLRSESISKRAYDYAWE